MKSKMNQKTAVLALCAVSCLAGALTGCSTGGGSSVDSSKTQLYVKCYQGGYGNKWLYSAKERYETLHANDSFEDGKKGVQIIIADQKTTPSSSEIKNNVNELYFFEGLNYLNMVKDDTFEEITEYVTGTNPYETGKTIESKMTADCKDYLNLADSDGTKHYYAIPNYSVNFGIVYNKTVFKKYNFYFADGYESETPGSELRFIMSASDKKSKGPDGVYGTNDDGLPTTYDEFFELVNYIYEGKQIPFVWRGEGNGKDYFGYLLDALAGFYDGATQTKTNFTMDGEITVVKMNDKGSDVVYNEDGSPVTEKVTVHPEKVNGAYDGYNVQRTAGKYHALDFVRTVVTNKDKWLCNLVTDSTTHLDAQTFFVNSQFGRLAAHQEQKNKSIAMLLDGDWWESEASETISSLADNEKSELDFGWMPLPKADDASNAKQTVVSDLTSMVFMKKGLSDSKKKLAGDFMQYMNTDEAYREFTTITNAVKYYNYDLTDEDKTKMSNFGKDYWEYYHNADVILPQSKVAQYTNGLGQQMRTRRYAISAASYFPQNDFINNSGLTAGQYLAQVFNYYKNSIWTGLK